MIGECILATMFVSQAYINRDKQTLFWHTFQVLPSHLPLSQVPTFKSIVHFQLLRKVTWKLTNLPIDIRAYPLKPSRNMT